MKRYINLDVCIYLCFLVISMFCCYLRNIDVILFAQSDPSKGCLEEITIGDKTTQYTTRVLNYIIYVCTFFGV